MAPIRDSLVAAVAGIALLASSPVQAKDAQACQRRRQQEVTRYMRIAEAYNRACLRVKQRNTLGTLKLETGVFCGYPGLVKEDPKDRAAIQAYFSRAKAYASACQAMKRQGALATETMQGQDCGFAGVRGEWPNCPDVR